VAKIWKRTDRDTWCVDYRDAGGVRRRLTANSRAQAEALLAEKVKDSCDGPPLVRGQDPLLADYAQRWLAAAATRIKPQTLVSYRSLLSNHILPALGQLRMRALHRLHIKELLADKRAAGLSKNSVRLIKATLSAMCAEACEDAIIKVNPAAFSTRRGSAALDGISHSERRAAIRPFSTAELEALLDVARAHPERHVLYLLLARTGMRPGEALGLRWDDLDLTRREILVERSVALGEIVTTKTGHARRVDMSRELAAALAALYLRREKEALRHSQGEITQWVFCSRRGGLRGQREVRRQFMVTMRRAGLSGHRLYDLRHTFATLLLAGGMPLTYVAAQLGHAKPTTTLSWYSHWLPRTDKSFVDFLDSADFLAPVGTKPTANEGEESGKVPDVLEKIVGRQTNHPVIRYPWWNRSTWWSWAQARRD
jgi:integrase